MTLLEHRYGETRRKNSRNVHKSRYDAEPKNSFYKCTRVSPFGGMFQHLLQTLELGLVFLHDGRENILLKKIFTAYSVFKVYICTPQRNTNKDPTFGLLVDVPLLPFFVAESSTRWSKKYTQNFHSMGCKQPRNFEGDIIYIAPKDNVNMF